MKVSLEKKLMLSLIILVVILLVVGFIVVQQVRETKSEKSAEPDDGKAKVQIRISPSQNISAETPEEGVATG